MSLINLLITSNGTKADFQSQSNLAPGGLAALTNFANYLTGLAGGEMIDECSIYSFKHSIGECGQFGS